MSILVLQKHNGFAMIVAMGNKRTGLLKAVAVGFFLLSSCKISLDLLDYPEIYTEDGTVLKKGVDHIWDGESFQGGTPNYAADKLQVFLDNLPANRTNMNFNNVILSGFVVPSLTEVDKKLLADWKELMVDIAENDLQFRKMGVKSDKLMEYGLPYIQKLFFGNIKKGTAGTFNPFSLSIFIDNVDTKQHSVRSVLLHEFSHAVFRYGDNMADFFAEMVSGDKPKFHFDWDWMYGSEQISILWRASVEEGREAEFWQAGSYEKKLQKIWNELSPQYTDETGNSLPLINYKEWQTIRAISGVMRDDMDRYSNLATDWQEKNSTNLLALNVLSSFFYAVASPSYNLDEASVKIIRDEVGKHMDFAEDNNLHPEEGTLESGFKILGRSLQPTETDMTL